MTMIQKSKSISVEGVSYELKFPKVGQYLDIENMKMMLTNGMYADMLQSRVTTAFYAVELVDAISLFYVMIPQLRDDLNVKNYNELDSFLAKKIVSVYRKQVKEWYDGLLDELLKIDDDFNSTHIHDEE